jgi:hypothetical protein
MAFDIASLKRAARRVARLVVGGNVEDSTIVHGSRNIVVNGVLIAEPGWLAERLRLDLGLSPERRRALLQRYLTFVVDSYRFLDFKGLGFSDRAPLRLPLAEMYVPLSARAELPRGETWSHEELRVAGRAPSDEETAAMGARSRPTLVLHLLARQDGLIVLGDPGAGKTTLLKYLALQLAQGQGDAVGLGARLPVLVPLAAYASALHERDVPLDAFIGAYFTSRGIELSVDALLREALERGTALVLLDGLDEVKDEGRRDLALRRVRDFFRFHRRAGNKFVLTSRIVGYREVRAAEEGLGECTLTDFG